MRIIISGATSMLGTSLITCADRNNDEVYAIVRPNSTRMNRLIRSKNVHYITGSLEELNKTDGLPSVCDVFYHFAWAGTKKEERNNPMIQEKNIGYTLDAVELAEKTGCKKFIGAGSQAEYGPCIAAIDESTNCNPLISYGISKYAAGLLSKRLCEKKGIEHVWGRIFSLYGPHDNDGTMLDYAIKKWKEGETACFSSGQQYWNYLFETDAGELFYRMGKMSVAEDLFLVASPESKPLREYIEILMKVYGPNSRVSFAEKTNESIPGLNVNCQRTYELLKYRPKVDFASGIQKMILSRSLR